MLGDRRGFASSGVPAAMRRMGPFVFLAVQEVGRGFASSGVPVAMRWMCLFFSPARGRQGWDILLISAS